ncbi:MULTISPECIES: FeoA family protein [Aminobacterium]|jgi:ferrous iron transport protein A|uniref:FeoA family protein n=1 Tax=Aminobacterium colombiense (strain DSM 12261 / ALA-1) TaxID=572547 RepID=D5EFN5_AMICL|nr:MULTISPECIES: FeoA family protein [Aminobacterium]MDD2379407.1 FeoA family protein [Aminobacterium colombiense]ADE57367.1 FeoA family protein [Aminobacterium colombiense DSM 12261]MDD3768553.1 FeoA family protein [Aminobacterium colombiense]MDD4265900.1 FeoA family protein [Aminobacterium colombiense]MDD4586298.1 FeoA family protein [Aminobacterium colombiense]
MMPLSFVREGAVVKVENLAGGMSFRKRMAELGLLPGSVFTVLRTGGGPFLLKIGETRLALGQGVGNRIFVREI